MKGEVFVLMRYCEMPRSEGKIYAFCALEPWHHEIEWFATSKEIETNFLERYELTPWAQ